LWDLVASRGPFTRLAALGSRPQGFQAGCIRVPGPAALGFGVPRLVALGSGSPAALGSGSLAALGSGSLAALGSGSPAGWLH